MSDIYSDLRPVNVDMTYIASKGSAPLAPSYSLVAPGKSQMCVAKIGEYVVGKEAKH